MHTRVTRPQWVNLDKQTFQTSDPDQSLENIKTYVLWSINGFVQEYVHTNLHETATMKGGSIFRRIFIDVIWGNLPKTSRYHDIINIWK